MTSAAGAIIYKAFAPTIKMMICIAVGFLISKLGLFTAAHAKGVSVVTLNISLPALTFVSMVSTLSVENGGAFGPLILVAALYQFLGFLTALLIREFLYVPADFRYGIFVMGICSNWGNLPTAVVQTVAKNAPFNPSTDPTLGIAYIAIFVFMMNTALFPCGLHKLCALDFRDENLLMARPPPLRERWASRWHSLRSSFTSKKDDSDYTLNELSVTDERKSSETANGEDRRQSSLSSHDERGDVPTDLLQRKISAFGAEMSRKRSRASSFTSMMDSTRPIPPTVPLEGSAVAETCPASSSGLPTACNTHGEQYNFHDPIPRDPSVLPPTFVQRFVRFLRGLIMPLTVAIVLGIICAMVQPLKALFVVVDGWSGTRVPYAPDGNPPLSFVTDTATFLGGITIPSGLILLGASFARIKVPKNWKELPIAAIVAMTVAKMILIPVFGVFFVQALRDKTTMYPSADKMRVFASILLSGTPASVNQLVITQLYNPAGTSDTLSSFLLLQYLTMPILSTMLAAIALFIAERS